MVWDKPGEGYTHGVFAEIAPRSARRMGQTAVLEAVVEIERQRLIDRAVRKVMQHMRIGPRGLVHGERFTINVQREFLRLSRSPQG